MSLKDWSTTAASNTSAPPNGWPEGMTIANVNNCGREMMAVTRNFAAEDTIASATTCDLGTKDAMWLTITGATTITGFGTVAAGIYKFVTFSGALTLTHNATSLILLTGANRTTVAGDCALYKSKGSGNWQEYFYSAQGSYQPLDATLTALAAALTASNKIPYATALNTLGELDFKDEDNMASDSATALPSQQSVKAYVDASQKIAQVVSTATSAVATGTTTIPFDDTIPQNTEGTEFITLAITPQSAANTLHISATLVAATSANVHIIAALFQDTTADAIAATAEYISTANGTTTINIDHYMAAGTTSATTFKIRIGPHAAATITFNGNNAGRIFGAITKSSMSIEEISA